MKTSYTSKYLPWLTERVKNRFKTAFKWIWTLSVWTVCVIACYLAWSLTAVKADTIVTTENDGTTTTTTTTVTTVKTNNTDPMKSNTPNLLENNGFQTGNTNGWTVTGDVNVCSTCGPFGGKAVQTPGEDPSQPQSNNGQGITGGATLTQDVNFMNEFTVDEMNLGFDLAYGSHIHSGSANPTQPSCSVAGTADCKDLVTMTMTLFDAGTKVNEFVHEIELDFSGWNTTSFFFEQSIPTNSFSDLTGTFSLFGVDAGFTQSSGQNTFFGPRFDNTLVAVKSYHEIVSQSVTTFLNDIDTGVDDITSNDIEMEFETGPSATEEMDMEFDSIEVEIEMNGSDMGTIEIQVADLEMEVDTTGGMESYDTGTDSNEMTEMTTESAVAEVEAAMEESTTDGETNQEEQTNSDSAERQTADSEANGDSEQEVAEEGDAEEGAESKQQVAKQEDKKEDNKQTAKEKKQSSKEKKKELANKVAKKILAKMGDKYGGATQATTLALMSTIGEQYKVDNTLFVSEIQFYDSTTMVDSVLNDSLMGDYMNSYQNDTMNQLINAQY